ncbi:MAG: tRNA (adenosine(37)-N6)-threonylcarbamoyltransferase complex transferase subunit TsaD [Candidatus Nealsonbacteria bacterium]
MKILAIETSCDDTAIAVLEIKNSKLEILSNIISSQVKLHAQYGGVYPFMAKREHQRNLPLVLKKAIKKARNPKIDAIAVTMGPGLEPCLWVGINFANDLAKKLNVPLFPVNHVEAHILANFLNERGPASNIFPAVGLVVSGGHTQLILMKKFLDYKILGETRDDAAGECFDKVARILGLGYPGGPAIAKLAGERLSGGEPLSIKLPRPMIKQKNYDFSFSGLKTAVLYEFRKQTPQVQKSPKYIRTVCAEVQQAIIDVLLSKTMKAVKNFRAKTVILGGGVTANDELRKQFKKSFNVLMPEKKFCTDNAAMAAITAYFHIQKGWKLQKEIGAKADLTL